MKRIGMRGILIGEFELNYCILRFRVYNEIEIINRGACGTG